jgi:hypothetical protein
MEPPPSIHPFPDLECLTVRLHVTVLPYLHAPNYVPCNAIGNRDFAGGRDQPPMCHHVA